MVVFIYSSLIFIFNHLLWHEYVFNYCTFYPNKWAMFVCIKTHRNGPIGVLMDHASPSPIQAHPSLGQA